MLSIDSLHEERQFSAEYIYFKFETFYGCQGTVKPVFPNQDNKEEYMSKDKKEEETVFGIGSTAKMRKKIEKQVDELFDRPLKGAEFLEDLDELLEKRKDRIKQKRYESPVNYVVRNLDSLEMHPRLNELKKKLQFES